MSETEGTVRLAEALRELKGRSGLSYGVLAKRLHLSASTLHRYCNGDAVPTEFAPVERLARLCGATPDEMVRVHRLWILADAGRGKRAVPGAEAATVRDESVSTSGTAESAPTPAPTPALAEPAPAEPVSPDPVQEPQPQPPADHDSAPLVSSVGGGSDHAPAPAPKRRRNALIGAATVLAVAASAVLVTQLTGAGPGHDGASGGRPVSARSPAGPTAGSGADAGGPVTSPPAGITPSGSRPSTPADTGTGSKGATGDDKADRNGQEGKEGQQGQGSSAAVPFSAAVRPFVYESPCSQYFLVDSPPDKVSPPPSEQDAPGWAASFKAVSADDQLVALTLQGRSEETVVLEALHVRVVRSGAPLPWNRYAAGVGCGGDVDTKSFTVDLDAGRPTPTPHAGQRGFPYKISEKDPEVFYVKARARAHDVSWYLELEWSSGDRHGVQRIDDHGKPFRTSGSEGRPLFNHPLGSSAWEKPLDESG
ncbi:helix-turn-helix domain-containing protein [Streptomyces sp. NBC_00237]|uniref:transcriptional regulator n=1 Tax=Streptomyces sp. NBC_00237 TaxID=2975687 RepID=UPI00225B0C00|nr:transcriptional regulator [Streptomyces sp. NBC_00237]MCX5205036.1 helix-turn-helix domain-containing protein [Streptomyces sp. NBC_00237]